MKLIRTVKCTPFVKVMKILLIANAVSKYVLNVEMKPTKVDHARQPKINLSDMRLNNIK